MFDVNTFSSVLPVAWHCGDIDGAEGDRAILSGGTDVHAPILCVQCRSYVLAMMLYL